MPGSRVVVYYYYYENFIDKVQTERVRTGLEVPSEALLQLHIQQTLHRRKYTYLQT